MDKITKGVKDAIETLFNTLPEQQQVDLLAHLYNSMYDLRKDQFLKEIED